ncbi:MAG: CHASE2 domain-containing protein [Solirubrobacterales bacterium]
MLRNKRLVALFGVSLGLSLFVLLAYGFGALKSLELSSVDKRFTIRGEKDPSVVDDAVVVGVDDVTFDELGVQWPFPRGAHAQLIDTLKADGANVIAMDIQFTEPSGDSEQDDLLIDSVTAAGNVVLATAETDDGSTRVFGGDDVVEGANATVGNSLFPEDSGGVVRRVEYERGGIPTFSVAVANRVTGKPVAKSQFDEDGAWIDYAGKPKTIETISYSTVINEEFPPGTFKDKIVVVGATSPTLQDLHRTPTSGDGEMAGPELQANAVLTALAGYRLDETGPIFGVLLILLLGFVTPLASIWLNPRGAFAVSVATAITFTLVAYFAFTLGWIILYVYPMIALALSIISALAVNFLAAQYERERVRDVFSRFVADSVVDQVLQQSEDGVKLGGRRTDATLLFSDLRGFTSFAEKLEPELVIDILNRYLTEMTDAILDHEGTLVSFMGDGIMAVFGAPVDSKTHADTGLAAARGMLDRMHGFNAWMEENGHGHGFKMGIGLNTGPVMSGNVGSERRLEYTTIGDTTNTAARLEGATKGTPYQLYMAQSTMDQLSERPTDFEFVEDMPIRGRQDGVRVWGLVEPDQKEIEALG